MDPASTLASTSSSTNEIISTNPNLLLDPQDQEERRREREACVARALVSNQRFQALGTKLHQAKSDKLKKLQDDIRNRRCPIFQRRLQRLDAEFDAKRNTLRVARQLRIEALARKQAGELEIVEHNFECQQKSTKERISTEIETKLQKLADEERRMEVELCQLYGPSEAAAILGGSTNNPTNAGMGMAEQNHRNWRNYGQQDGAINRYQVEEEPNSAGTGKRTAKPPTKSSNTAVKQCRLWRDIPVIIGQLPNRSIQEDLTKLL